jgi:hypothetical protein
MSGTPGAGALRPARNVFATPGGTTTVGPPPLSTPPFPARYPDPLRQNIKLQDALNSAIRTGPGQAWRTPVCIVSLEDPAGAHPSASFRGDEVHYSASLVKVAAMYACFELRKTLRSVAQEIGTSAPASSVLSRAATYLDPRIYAGVSGLPALRGVARQHAVPKYSYAFTAAAGGASASIDFSPAVTGNLRQMISISSNSDAGACVHSAGYGYLNGALAAAGFFDPSTAVGLWLGGDYAHQYPYYVVQSVNDHAVAQAATVLSLARLFTLLADHTLVDSGSSGEMLDLLTTSVAAGEVYITRASFPLGFTVTHGKLGLGPLKTGTLVCSEAAIVRHRSGARFVVAWQNFVWGDDGVDPMARVARDTINAYLGP